MSTTLNFGNGIIATTRTTGAARIQPGHSGLDFPTVDVPVSENAVLDGAAVGSSRARGRRMVVPLYLRGYTRGQIAAAFSPNVERTLTTGTVSLPYYVEDCIFNTTALTGPQEVRVVLVSPLAYPEGELTSVTIEGGGGWAAESVSAEQTTENATLEAPGGGVGQCVALSAGDRVTGFTFKTGDRELGEYDEGPITERGFYVRIYNASAGIPSGTALYSVQTSTKVAANTVKRVNMDWIVPASGTYALEIQRKSPRATAGNFRYNTAGGYASGDAFRMKLDLTYEVITGDDLYFLVHTQAVDAGTGTATFTADTDVPAKPVITCTMVTPDDDLVIAGDDWTTTITDTLAAGDVVEVDAENFTVKVNGTSALSAFDRSGDWPSIQPGENTITVTPAAGTSIAFKPRRMGLI